MNNYIIPHNYIIVSFIVTLYTDFWQLWAWTCKLLRSIYNFMIAAFCTAGNCDIITWQSSPFRSKVSSCWGLSRILNWCEVVQVKVGKILLERTPHYWNHAFTYGHVWELLSVCPFLTHSSWSGFKKKLSHINSMWVCPFVTHSFWSGLKKLSHMLPINPGFVSVSVPLCSPFILQWFKIVPHK